jgi:enamidase
MLRIMAELVSLGPLTPRQAITATTGNVREVYGIPGGRIAVGEAADFVVIDAPLGSAATDAFSAMERGDLPAVGAVVTDGVIRLTKSRNTPPPQKPIGNQTSGGTHVC